MCIVFLWKEGMSACMFVMQRFVAAVCAFELRVLFNDGFIIRSFLNFWEVNLVTSKMELKSENCMAKKIQKIELNRVRIWFASHYKK